MTAPASLRLSAAALFGALMLAACVPSATEWVKEGASPDDLRVAQRECERTYGDYSFIETVNMSDPVGMRGSSARASGSVAGDSYRSCMEGQGWRRQRGNQQPAAR